MQGTAFRFKTFGGTVGMLLLLAAAITSAPVMPQRPMVASHAMLRCKRGLTDRALGF